MTRAGDSSNTRDIIDRLYRKHRRKLLNQAAKFFRTHDTILGLDAESLLHEAIAKVLHNGFPSNTNNHMAYLMTTIERQGIQRVHRRMETDKAKAPKNVRVKARSVPADPSSGVEETVIDRLERDITTEEIRSALKTLPANARRVAQAMVKYPDHTESEIAGALGVSRSTISRAKRVIKEDPTLRHLALDTLPDHYNGDQPPMDRRRTP